MRTISFYCQCFNLFTRSVTLKGKQSFNFAHYCFEFLELCHLVCQKPSNFSDFWSKTYFLMEEIIWSLCISSRAIVESWTSSSLDFDSGVMLLFLQLKQTRFLRILHNNLSLAYANNLKFISLAYANNLKLISTVFYTTMFRSIIKKPMHRWSVNLVIIPILIPDFCPKWTNCYFFGFVSLVKCFEDILPFVLLFNIEYSIRKFVRMIPPTI